MIYLFYPYSIKQNYIISNLYLLLILEVLYYLKDFLILLKNKYNKDNKYNKIFFKIKTLVSHVDINSIDSFQNINNLLKIILNIKIKSSKYKIKKEHQDFDIILFVLPLIFNNNLVLNGLYKTCIQLFKKDSNIQIISGKKDQSHIIYIYVYINYNVIMIFEIDNTKDFKDSIVCYLENKKIDFFVLLICLDNIFKNKKISLLIKNYFIFKKMFIYNYIKLFKYDNNIKIKDIIFIKLYIYENLLSNNNINIVNNLINDLLKILFSIKTNFEYYTNYSIDNIYNKKYYSIIDTLSDQCKNSLDILQENLLNKNEKLDTNKLVNILSEHQEYKNILLEKVNINPLIQYTDQINNLSEINQKFKINMITTGLSSKYISNISLRELPRDALGFISLINTNEGVSCGLINYLLTNVFLNIKHKIITYYKYLFYNKYNFKVMLDIFNKDFYNIGFNHIYLKKNRNFNKTTILSIHRNTFKINNCITKDSIYLPFNYLLSFIENLIPFVHYNDPTRNLMSIKMHTQAVPIIYPTLSNVITNYNFIINKYLNYLVVSYQEGIVTYVSSIKIIIRDILNRQIIYYLNNYKKLNQNTLLYYKPIVWVGERVNIGQILAVNSNLLYSEYSLGNNLLIGYGSYLGYEYEDSIVINKKVIYNNLYTSLHFDIFETSLKMFDKRMPEISSINSPKIYNIQKHNLDKYGIIKEGTYLLPNNILISKLILNPVEKIFKTKTEQMVFRMLQYIYGPECRDIKYEPFISTYFDSGRIVKVELLPSSSSSDLEEVQSYLKIRIYIGIQKYLHIGDKLCNRHGHKGIISYINEINDMPFLNNSMQPDLFISSVGVPSRINIGQIFEGIYGLTSLYSNYRYIISNNLNKNYYSNYINIYNYYKYNYNNNFDITKVSYSYNKFYLKNPFTGHIINNGISLNNIYYYKLIHMVTDKFRYRSTGLYSELTQQPEKGETKEGGQRFGEMEVWALEAYGASYLFREFFTYKADDVKSRRLLKKYLLYNEPQAIQYTNLPETYKFIVSELKALAIDLEAFYAIDEEDSELKPMNIYY